MDKSASISLRKKHVNSAVPPNSLRNQEISGGGAGSGVVCTPLLRFQIADSVYAHLSFSPRAFVFAPRCAHCDASLTGKGAECQRKPTLACSSILSCQRSIRATSPARPGARAHVSRLIPALQGGGAESTKCCHNAVTLLSE